ncbi:MAG: helix-turn-helix transcriptional regulator [Actinomycetota bacterium]
MGEHEFSLVIDGPVEDETVVDKLFEAGCSDATIGSVDGVGYADFHREAETFADVVLSALRDVESVPGLKVLRVEPDDLVTMSEIAERLGRTRESIRLLVSGRRGRGNFPAPISHLRSRSRLWRWSEVAEWAETGTAEEQRNARFVASINAALELRRQRQDLADQERSILEALPG